MDPTTLAILALLGTGATGLSLRRNSNEVVWGALGVVIWSVFGLGATHVEIFDNGTVFVRTYGSVALVAVGIVALNLYVMLFGTVALFRREEAEEDLGRGPL